MISAVGIFMQILIWNFLKLETLRDIVDQQSTGSVCENCKMQMKSRRIFFGVDARCSMLEAHKFEQIHPNGSENLPPSEKRISPNISKRNNSIIATKTSGVKRIN